MSTEQASKSDKLQPSPNTLWVTGWHSLNFKISTAEYRVTNEMGETRTIHANKNKRRILEGLIKGPMYGASPFRLSHYVQMLREENGLNIETEWYSNDPLTGCEQFGVYVLKDEVTRIDQQEVTA